MGMSQATLKEFADCYQWREEPFTKTVVFDLEPPTARKRQRLDDAIAAAQSIRAEAARRMPGLPTHRWSEGKLSTLWKYWTYDMNHHLSPRTAKENVLQVRESFNSWKNNGYPGDRPAVDAFADSDQCAFKCDQPRYFEHEGRFYLSLPLAAGHGEREAIPIRDADYYQEYLAMLAHGQADVRCSRGALRRTDGVYSFHQALRTTVEVIDRPATAVGIDVGLTNLATAAAYQPGNDKKLGAELWSGSEAAHHRNRIYERRQQTQQEGRIQELRDEDERYVDTVCHQVSREVVEYALGFDRPKIWMEDLTDIRRDFEKREREYTAETRRVLHSWPFRKLQDMIEYKATEAGIPVDPVSPRNTSIRCNECGSEDRENREGTRFECLDCGYEVNADVNGAFNIARRPDRPD